MRLCFCFFGFLWLVLTVWIQIGETSESIQLRVNLCVCVCVKCDDRQCKCEVDLDGLRSYRKKKKVVKKNAQRSRAGCTIIVTCFHDAAPGYGGGEEQRHVADERLPHQGQTHQ